MSKKAAPRRRKPPAKQAGAALDAQAEQTLIPYDENLLERARIQWQFGDWQSIAQLSLDTLQHHPDRAKLALLAAAGRLQTGKDDEARQYIRLAQDWGVSKRLVIQILIAGVHNSLGRMAAIGGRPQRALQHFHNAISIGTPGSAIDLVASARAKHELEALGLIPGSQGRLQQLQASADLVEQAGKPVNAAATLRPVSDAHEFYLKLSRSRGRQSLPFLLIDSKSLPRSGLHYLKNTLGRIFGEHFSFCEWYQETGCCKKMPCTLTGFATYAQESRQLRIRLIKSHDFELDDPNYPTTPHLRRLILIRDPLYILTSWFAMDQLESNRTTLAQHGINVEKIWLAHEQEVLDPAYRLLDERFEPPPLAQLTEWLEKKSQYIIGFMDKWVKPGLEQPDSQTQVIRYEDINHYIKSLADEFGPYMTSERRVTFRQEMKLTERRFKKREDPFRVPSEKLSYYIKSHSAIFEAAANNIKRTGHKC